MNHSSLILQCDPESLARAASMLREGKLVAFPTETVYGLGADATNDRAVAAIYAAKGRPQFNPLIVHVAKIEALDSLIVWNAAARMLAEAVWPGPLTLVLPRHPHCPVSRLASAGTETLAVRMPSHPVAQALIERAGVPVAAPSANASGKLSPTEAAHVAESLVGAVDAIIDGGRCAVGVESTVVSWLRHAPEILRPGGVPREQIEKILGRPVAVAELSAGEDSPAPSPGLLSSHYAPRAALRLNALFAEGDEALLTFGEDMHVKGGTLRLNLSPSGDVHEAAANLFAMLHRLDAAGVSRIAVMPIPEEGLGIAINDRLRRGAVR
ncbi:MAG: L-threonylcarbamoyladenylate synthase [Bdellovibrionales bacterium]